MSAKEPILDEAESESFRQKARAWLEQNAPAFEVPDASRQGNLDTQEEFDRYRAWNQAKAAAGWSGIHWPEHCGGRGLSRVHTVLYEQEESDFLVPRGSYLNVGWSFAAPTLMHYASEEVQAKLLPRILTVEDFWCQLFSEPVAGSDLAGIRTRAERQDDEWVVNGQKVWTTYAQWAQWAILVARHDFDEPKHKGLVYFFVDMRSPGVEVRGIRQISGAHHFNEVFLTNVRIPDSQRLGAVGEGWQVALTTLMNERLGSGFTEARPSWRDLLAFSQGNDDRADAALRNVIADAYVQSRGVELIRERNISRLLQGQQPGPEASVAKVVSSSLRQDLAIYGLDLLEQSQGGDLGDQFRRGFFDAPGNRIAGGTDEIVRNILAERVLGLPGDVRVDRDLPFRELTAREGRG
ncbi:MAG: acyl-CoA dehydrogenase family protein [Acidobacteriota bacterium]